MTASRNFRLQGEAAALAAIYGDGMRYWFPGLKHGLKLLKIADGPGTDPSQFTIEFVTGFGQPTMTGTINVIPEPGTVIMLLSGLLGLALLVWRRRRMK